MEAKDPRDIVYAHLGMISDSAGNLQHLVVNYE